MNATQSTTSQLIESILFIAARPLTSKKLAEIAGRPITEVETALSGLMEEYRDPAKGIQINKIGQSFQLATVAVTAEIVQKFLEEEEKKELTKPSLEALTIIAYRGPVSKDELELIRGVNCSLILRNLLIRGLIETIEDPITKLNRYQVTFDFLQYLGIRETRELPEYEKLNSDDNLQKLINETITETEPVNEGDVPLAGSPDSDDQKQIDAHPDDGAQKNSDEEDDEEDEKDEEEDDDDEDDESSEAGKEVAGEDKE